MPDTVYGFRGRWSFLSNFHPAVLTWEGIEYPTSEHAFNAGKTTVASRRLWVAAAPTPREAKRRGRQVDLRAGWDERVRFEVMDAVLRAKFTCRPARTDALLSTGTMHLVEANTWHDNTWGDCGCGRAACAAPGANHLGRLLMELRAELAGAPKQRKSLTESLDDLAGTDPDVAETADGLHWMAQKAAMGWPAPRRFCKSPPPDVPGTAAPVA